MSVSRTEHAANSLSVHEQRLKASRERLCFLFARLSLALDGPSMALPVKINTGVGSVSLSVIASLNNHLIVLPIHRTSSRSIRLSGKSGTSWWTGSILFERSITPAHPILSAPDDILLHIFESCAIEDQELLLTLAAVCTRWHNLVCNNPSLWSAITIDPHKQ